MLFQQKDNLYFYFNIISKNLSKILNKLNILQLMPFPEKILNNIKHALKKQHNFFASNQIGIIGNQNICLTNHATHMKTKRGRPR